MRLGRDRTAPPDWRWPTRQVRYGEHRKQLVEVVLPDDTPTARPAVVLVHGGFWSSPYALDLMRPLADALARDGWASANLEYRSMSPTGRRRAGWPDTFTDAAAALDVLADVPEVDERRLVVVGHSAGGHLGLWLAARHRLPAGAPGADPRVRPAAVVSLAGVNDLTAGARRALGGGAVVRLLGGTPEQMPQTYALADPARLLPLGVPQLLVSGDLDDRVPVVMSRAYAETARRAGDPVELVELAGADHFALIDPAHEAWTAVTRRLPALVGGSAAE